MTSLLIFMLVQVLAETVVVAVPSALVVSTVFYLVVIKWVPLSRRSLIFSRAGYLLLIATAAAWATAFFGFYRILHSQGPIEDVPLRSAARWFVVGSVAALSGFCVACMRWQARRNRVASKPGNVPENIA